MNRRNLAIAYLALAALPVARAGEPAPDRVFVGYLYGSPRGIDYKLYTHLCHAFLVADGDGTVKAGRNVPSREFTLEAHQAGVKVLVSLGGWGWDRQFAAITADPEAEKRYVHAVMDIVRDADYDGIDLDWEYPDTEAEVRGFERLCRTFRADLDALGESRGRPMVLTMAASSGPGTLKWLRTEFLVETMDWVNLMTYDMAGSWTPYAGHNAPLHASSKQPEGRPISAEASVRYLLEERKLPPDRLALGIPLYGRGFAVKEPYAPTAGAPKRDLPGGDYRSLRRLLKEGWTRLWDDEIQAPWLLAPDGSAVFGYDDAESVAIKARWARDKGLRGVFFWQVAGDRLDDGSHPLQEAAREALLGAPREAPGR